MATTINGVDHKKLVSEGESVTERSAGTELAIRSIGRNTIFQIGSQVAPALAALAAIPFLLRQLGPEIFGIVTIFSTTLIYFTMLDLGLGRAATRFIAQSLEDGKPDDLRRYFWGSIILLSGIGVLVTVGCLLAVPVAVTKYLKVPIDQSHLTIASFYIICLTIPVVTLTGTFRGYLEASGRFFYIGVVTGCSGIALYALPAFVVSMGGGLLGVAVALAAVRVALCAALALGCLHVDGRPSLYPVFDVVTVRRMLSFGGWLSVSNVVGTGLMYCDRIFVAMWVGIAAVSSYGMPLDVISRMLILVTGFCTVLFPLMSRLDKSESPEFQTVYRGAVGACLALMTPLAVSGVVLAPAVMKLWLGERNTPDSVFAAQVFLAGMVVQSIASIAFTGLHARGRSDLTAWVHLAEVPLYCGAFYLAATRFGVRGAALAWLARGIVDFLCMVILLKTRKGMPGSVPSPELVAGIISAGILLTTGLSFRGAALSGLMICAFTWIWVWRTVIDPSVRMVLARVLVGREDPRPVV
jgi:O-antigen/teichoic acid export membrane protein